MKIPYISFYLFLIWLLLLLISTSYSQLIRKTVFSIKKDENKLQFYNCKDRTVINILRLILFPIISLLFLYSYIVYNLSNIFCFFSLLFLFITVYSLFKLKQNPGIFSINTPICELTIVNNILQVKRGMNSTCINTQFSVVIKRVYNTRSNYYGVYFFNNLELVEFLNPVADYELDYIVKNITNFLNQNRLDVKVSFSN